MSRPQRRLRILSPLAERDFRLLWAGQTVSLLGDGITTIALAWQTYELSRSLVALSLVLLAWSVPMLVLLLIGGAVSDRFPRRGVMLSSDVVRGATVGGIALLSAGGVLEVWHLVVLAAVFGAADAFFQPAYSAIFPDILPERMLLQANSLTAATRPLTLYLAGPALGGLLVGALGSAAAFGADAATFAVSAACLLGMRSRPGRETGDRKILAEIGEGLRYTRRTRWMGDPRFRRGHDPVRRGAVPRRAAVRGRRASRRWGRSVRVRQRHGGRGSARCRSDHPALGGPTTQGHRHVRRVGCVVRLHRVDRRGPRACSARRSSLG